MAYNKQTWGDLVKTMMEAWQTDDGSWSAIDAHYEETFHSKAGAYLEASALYLDASDLPKRWANKQETRVLDIGLGLGINALTAIQSWQASDHPGSFGLISLEKNPTLLAGLLGSKPPWQQSWPNSWHKITGMLTPIADNSAHYRGSHQDLRLTLEHPQGSSMLEWTIYLGDGVDRLSRDCSPHEKFDVFWQDAFSPAKNPELWTPEWFQLLRDRALDDAVLVTYSVARVVKEGLEQAEWNYTRIPTAGGQKKSWLRAQPRLANS